MKSVGKYLHRSRDALLIILALSLLGCKSYNDIPSAGPTIEPSNPAMVFSLPHRDYPATRHNRVSGERFYRPEWPIPQVPQGYVRGAEQAVYYENIRDYQYNTSDHRARDRFYRQSQTSRLVVKYR